MLRQRAGPMFYYSGQSDLYPRNEALVVSAFRCIRFVPTDNTLSRVWFVFPSMI